jgi:hypothetical protein
MKVFIILLVLGIGLAVLAVVEGYRELWSIVGPIVAVAALLAPVRGSH